MKKDKKILVKGVEAIALGALEADCKCYFGYPITPQNDIPEFMSRELPKRGGVFLQAESELAAINMVLGACATGTRAMTSSSSPGISLMCETFSYLAALELPAVVVNVMRGGPGLGGIETSQGDYFQATKGSGHGDFRFLVLAPSNAQEAYELTAKAFELAEKYRNPVMVLSDAILGQMKEPIVLKKLNIKKYPIETWALTGAKGRESRFFRSLFLDAEELRQHNLKLMKKYRLMKKEIRYEVDVDKDVDVLVVAFGSMARIAKEAITDLQNKGYQVGYFRPITLYPFPEAPLKEIVSQTKKSIKILVPEQNCGQMVEDVKLAVEGKAEVISLAYPPSVVPFPEDLKKEIKKCLSPSKSLKA
ncbi:3-methyl-2-oxobutanoate dehydrogenase subunit VorB [Thermodesulfobacterium sp. TA1]|uniref:3-methyl-2-oxobutanoate dehydrogenase subunit VorB n=1 Tax=Thermodesulfobacterium sp. TA1 TaxID=2234087 RepID=UPI001232E07E|nr:3-methyl-2-oxobutanoate dehydrogenase subunit VorB [Thermodesulfobacterium sp. TA1]QER41793.1 3-methyl-2-oxobutanoate dehydrogenase subunit VorB [Thermodesulfobacterium sp. TA1]